MSIYTKVLADIARESSTNANTAQVLFIMSKGHNGELLKGKMSRKMLSCVPRGNKLYQRMAKLGY